MAYIYLEAEAFTEHGGWIMDCISMQQMGSAYLMAHGAGIPVADAVTEFEIPQDGKYFLYVRTRDWTAVWKRGTPAGRFQVQIDGTYDVTDFGTNGENWAWQKGGVFPLNAGKHTIALHDLTGFNGRCDAIYLSDDPNDIPPDTPEALEKFRKERSGIEIQDVAMAAKICRDHNVYPREVWTEHQDEFKQLMREGINTPEQFHCFCGKNTERKESYHFKETGHLFYRESDPKEYGLPEQIQQDILQLKRHHLLPETGK